MFETAFDTTRAPESSCCPACRRPVAVIGARCVYCGADLPECNVDSRARETSHAQPSRVVLIVDTSADARTLATVLGRRVAEMEALKLRRRYLLHRILPAPEAQAEIARLTAQGLGTIALSESAVREASQPLLATGGEPAKGLFTLDLDGGTRQLGTDDVLLVVWGPIRREPLSEETRSLRGLKRASASRATESDLCHVHTKSSPRPLELDPGSFTFAETRVRLESTLLRLRAAIATLATAAEIDHDFRQEAPALGVSGASQRAPLADALATKRSARGERRRPPAFLDNVAQFRFYSAWRGTLARHLAGLADTPGPPL
jgi:hypothetical protein